jgi:hypothetical protein
VVLLEAEPVALGAFATVDSLARNALLIDDLRFIRITAEMPATRASAPAPMAIHFPIGFVADFLAE